MRQRTLHQQVRVIYRACRRIYGTEKTQDECLRVFKAVYPEQMRLEASTSERETLDPSIRPAIQQVTNSWHPQRQLKSLIERIDNLIALPFDEDREKLIELLKDITPVAMRIRKLTPRECFRLMGVDEKDIDTIQASGLSKSAQYKMAGNSIVVDVMYYIFDKLFTNPTPDYKPGDQLMLF
jgi:hypothetical protein